MNDIIFDAAKKLIVSLPVKQRKELLALFIEPPKPGPALPAAPERILRRAEVASRLSRNVRAIDRLAARGVLHKVSFPGSKKAAGFLASEVDTLIQLKKVQQ